MLDVLANAHCLAHLAKALLHSLPGGDGGGGVALAQEVPAEEAGEVLECAERLVAADGGRYEAEVVGHKGVVYEGVGDHGCDS